MSLDTEENNYPLRFHHVHGENISLSKNGTVACRSNGYCKGIVFSNRPIMVGERIYVKVLEVSPKWWRGALRIGFTMNDPVYMESKLPQYSCPDLTSVYGNWAKPINEKIPKKNSVLCYYFDQNGNVHFGTDSEEYGIIFNGVNTSTYLWALLDIYANTLTIEFLDPRCLNLIGQNQSCSLQERNRTTSDQMLEALSFHSVHGKNLELRKNKSVVSRKRGFNYLTYAFTEYPLEIGKTIVMNVLSIDHYYKGLFVYGVTSCDPQNIDVRELPERVNELVDRPEYWVVKKKAYSYAKGDSIWFKINSQGQVKTKFNGVSEPVFHVDHTQPLWLFINLSHSISELKLAPLLYDNSSEEDLIEDFKDMKTNDSKKCEVVACSSCEQSKKQCIICCDESIDCVLYRCGHMCMCHKCAFKVFSSDSDAQCPICRTQIIEVIRIFN